MNLIQYALAQQIVDQYGAKDTSIANIELNSQNMLIVTLTDGRIINAGQIPTVSQGVVTEIVTEKVKEVKEEVSSLGLALENSSKDLAILKEQAITNITIGNTNITSKNNALDLPLASGDVVGLVMAKMPTDSATSVNSISINKEGYLEVNSLSVNKLIQEEEETLILDCSQTF